MKIAMHPASKGERDAEPGEMGEIVAAGFAAHQRNDAECADQCEGVDGGVKHRRGESFAPARDESKQCVTGVGDGGVGEQTADVGLRERDEISDDNRQSGQRSQDRCPAGNQCVPCRAAMHGAETDEQNFSEDDERRHLGARRDERGGRNGRAL